MSHYVDLLGLDSSLRVSRIIDCFGFFSGSVVSQIGFSSSIVFQGALDLFSSFSCFSFFFFAQLLLRFFLFQCSIVFDFSVQSVLGLIRVFSRLTVLSDRCSVVSQIALDFLVV